MIMKRLEPAGLMLGLALCSAIPADAVDPFEQYEWLHRGDAALMPALDDAQLTLPSERREELAGAGYGHVDLLWRFELTIAADSELLGRRVYVRHFLSQNGIQEAGNFAEPVRGASSDLYIDEASVWLPGGDHVEFDLKDVQVVTDPLLGVFSDQYLVVVPFEGLVPDSTAVLVTRTARQTRGWPLPWSNLIYTRWWAPVERIEVVVRWDADIEAPSWTTNDDQLKCEQTSERELLCTVGPVQPLPFDPGVASPYDIAPLVVVSEPQTWALLAEKVTGLLSRSRAQGGRVQALLERLLRDAATPLEKLNRIHRYVADEIRYVGIEHGTSAVEPASVSQTLARRYADCKGKVALFLELAERAGIEAWAVLVATEQFNLDGLVAPSWRYFDHMIACARLEAESEPLCIDLTDPYADTGQLPPRLYGAVALDLSSEVEAPRTLDAPTYIWEFHAVATNRMSCEGDVTEELRRHFIGPAAVAMRTLLSGMTTEERRRWAEESYKEVLPVETTPTFRFEGLEDPASELVIHSQTHFPGILGKELYEYRELDAWLYHFASWFMTENRHHPYRMDGARIRTTSTYSLCPAYKARFTGAELRFESEFGSLQRHYINEGSEVDVETVLEIPRALIDAAELPRYHRFLESSLLYSTIWFSVEQ